ncbi:MAG: hypothetical protein EVA89_19995 [Sandaracinaceae bacterium]|nr:MAG: hypothetical protein EVA89_19995 [Sandaracinaceae bacterium]
MGAAIVLRLEGGAPVGGLLDEGKVILAERGALADAAERAGVVPLDAFDAYAHLELPADFDGDPDWLAKLQEEAEARWFDPHDALVSVAAIQEAALDGLERYSSQETRGALAALRRALEAAAARGVRFHLDVEP